MAASTVATAARPALRVRRREGLARSVRRHVPLWVGILFIVVYCLFPFYWMILSSFETEPDIFDTKLWPTNPNLENYRAVFEQQQFLYNIRNSLVIAGSTTLLALLFGTLAAYALARLRFRGKMLVLGAVLAAAMFPPIAVLVPIFNLFSDFGWIDQYQAMVIPDVSFTLPLTVWILYAFFAEMPWELEKAALVDGATPGQAFRKVIVPLAAPGVFTAAILAFIWAWNEFMFAFAMSRTAASKPVTVAIATFTGAQGMQQPFGTIMAAGVIVTIPLVIMVLLFQRRIVAGLTAGGLKG